MKDALLLMLGAVISAWIGIATSKMFVFRQLKSRTLETFVQITRNDNLDNFVTNHLWFIDSFLPLIVAFRVEGHFRAARDLERLVTEINAELIKVHAHMRSGPGAHSHGLQFRIEAWKTLNDRRDLTERFEQLQPDRGVLLEPHW